MKTVIYARQSKTREGSESLDTQVATCRETAARLGMEVVEVLVEPPSTSGYKNRGKQRPKFPELLDGFRRGRWEVVIGYKTDRLSRGGGPGWAPLLDAIEAAGLNVDRAVATPSGFVSEFEIGIRAAMDREESKKLSERIHDISARKAAAGKPHGSKRAYGYEPDLITIRDSEATVLREMARRAIAYQSYKDIANWANSQGHRTSTGMIFWPVTVRNLLHKKRYGGIREYEGADYPGCWEPIFDAETYRRLQLTLRLRRDRQTAFGAPMARKYLLTGLVYCGKCGHPLNGSRMYDVRRQPGREDDYRRVYCCTKRTDAQAKTGCSGVRRNADAMDDFLTRCVLYRLDSPELGKLLRQQTDDDAEVVALLAERDACRTSIDALVEDRALGLLDRAQFARAKQTAESALLRVERLLAAATQARGAMAVLPVGESVTAWWDAATDEQRREVLRMLVEKITVNSGNAKPFYTLRDGTRARFAPDLIEVKWRA